jgi:hypothetical protein
MGSPVDGLATASASKLVESLTRDEEAQRSVGGEHGVTRSVRNMAHMD